jgi:hypothetical protein
MARWSLWRGRSSDLSATVKAKCSSNSGHHWWKRVTELLVEGPVVRINCVRLAGEVHDDQLMTTCVQWNEEFRGIACPLDLVYCCLSLERHICLDPWPASVVRVKGERAWALCSRMILCLGPVWGRPYSPSRQDWH